MTGREFYEQVVRKDPRFKSPRRQSDPMLLEPVTRARVQAVQHDALVEYGVRLGLFESSRSRDRQRIVHAGGSSDLGDVGVHYFALAADLVKLLDDDDDWSWKGDYSFMPVLARRHGLISGADWGAPGVPHARVDAVHLQRCTVAEQRRLFAGAWYPDDDHDPYAGAVVRAVPHEPAAWDGVPYLLDPPPPLV